MILYYISAVVIIMQLGIAYIEGGSVRYRNMQHIMIIVFVNASLSIIIMYAVKSI